MCPARPRCSLWGHIGRAVCFSIPDILSSPAEFDCLQGLLAVQVGVEHRRCGGRAWLTLRGPIVRIWPRHTSIQLIPSWNQLMAKVVGLYLAQLIWYQIRLGLGRLGQEILRRMEKVSGNLIFGTLHPWFIHFGCLLTILGLCAFSFPLMLCVHTFPGHTNAAAALVLRRSKSATSALFILPDYPPVYTCILAFW